MVTTSAPTKIILIGEHAVVYGKPGIALPVNLLTSVTMVPNTLQQMRMYSNIALTEKDRTTLQSFIQIIQDALPKKSTAHFFDITIHTTAPQKMGFGTSASVAVALTKALYAAHNTTIHESTILALALKLEQITHGTPSGIDHTTITCNTPILFQKTPDLRWTPLPKLLDNAIFNQCFLLLTGCSEESTKEMVAQVRAQYEKAAADTQAIFDAIEHQTTAIQTSLTTENESDFHACINTVGMLLEDLHVVSPKVMAISQDIRKNHGACKISGSGGKKGPGSGVLFVHHTNKEVIKSIAKKYTLEYIPLIA
ncbi:MAG: mevalonate kinase [Candidatus Magasanikbacteria bacterium]|nr:mevalonate kinase [Candidatus Magasanikbacteria bacterium]MBT5262504.1 mevalonate kinase [Candidatus Magasanikbacteria bacterium]MBT6294727.1 mevalonate kinase [Candidatus Magasanikbacteria bacterium]